MERQRLLSVATRGPVLRARLEARGIAADVDSVGLVAPVKPCRTVWPAFCASGMSTSPATGVVSSRWSITRWQKSS